MNVFAYLYTDPLIDTPTDPTGWGWEIDRVYRDLGGRQQLQQLLTDCRTEAPDVVLVWQVHDLGDSLSEISDRLAEFAALDIRLIAVTADGHTPGHLPQDQAGLLRLLQEVQDQHRSRRIRQGHARNRVKALPPPGKAPYGYRRGKDRYILDRSAATVVKDFFEHFLLYSSLRGAVRYLEKKHGKKISTSTAQRWLTNPVYRGNLAYQDGRVVPNTHAAILSRDEAAQVDRLLRRNRRLPSRTASAPRSLAGMVCCSDCQSPLVVSRVTTSRSDREYLYLRPIACTAQPKCKSLPYEQVLQQTIERICQDLPQAVAQLSMPDLDGFKQGMLGTIQGKEAVLNQIPDLVATGILDSETAELRIYKVRTEIAELQNRIAQLPPANLRTIAQTVSLPQFWLDLSESERRFYFREFIRQIKLIRHGHDWHLELVFIF